MGEDGKKGKAVYVLHTWKDCLWELGGGGEVPEPRDLEVESEEGDVITGEVESTAETTTEEPIQSTSKLTPQGIHILSYADLIFNHDRRSNINFTHIIYPISINNIIQTRTFLLPNNIDGPLFHIYPPFPPIHPTFVPESTANNTDRY